MQMLVAGAVLLLMFTGFLYNSIGGLVIVALLLLLAFGLWRTRFRVLRVSGVVLACLVALPPLIMGASHVYELLHTYVHRYRLVMEVETPNGVQAVSNVLQVSYTEYMLHWNPSASGLKMQVKGEALFFDLGHGRNLVATLGFGPTGANTDMLRYLAAVAFGRYRAFWYKQAPSWEGRAELYGELIPTLVTFGDPADPSTARVVKPEEFEAVFGPGYRFKKAWIEMTKDDVTRAGIEEMSY